MICDITEQPCFNIITVGVGGQGLMLLSNIIGNACIDAGLSIRTAETHGLAQRSGSIYTHVRIGRKILSPLIPYGEANVMVAMEAIEALRNCEFLAKNATIILNDYIWQPVQSTFRRVLAKGEVPYLSVDQIIQKLTTITNKIIRVNANAIAEQAGNALASNVVLLGALGKIPGFPLKQEQIVTAIKNVVPESLVQVNLLAFQLGFTSKHGDLK